jgi:Co/Zn/Cd efflux system component
VTAIQHLAAGAHHVEGLPVLIVSAIAAAVMLAGAPILGGDADDDGTEDLNVKAVLLDTAAAAGVAVSGAIIFCTGSTGPPRCHRGDHRLPRAEAHP